MIQAAHRMANFVAAGGAPAEEEEEEEEEITLVKREYIIYCGGTPESTTHQCLEYSCDMLTWVRQEKYA
jgi:hypothetical protein